MKMLNGIMALALVWVPGAVSQANEPTEALPPLKVFVFGNQLPKVQNQLAKSYALTILPGGPVAGKKSDNVVGLERLAEADVWIGSTAKRTLPSAEQLAHFQKFHQAGKPIVAFRQASHCFNNWIMDGKLVPEVRIDQVVFGAKYGVHHLTGKEAQMKIVVSEAGKKHPILTGLEPPPLTSVDNGSYIYTDLAADVTVLLTSGLPGDMMPHTWVREDKQTQGRVFYTRYDSKYIEDNPSAREIFVRGFLWAVQGAK